MGVVGHAQVFTVNLSIPDNSLVGVTSQQLVSGYTAPLASVSVFLRIEPRGGEPMFNGDIYATLSHESGYAVLLNRVGRRDGFSAGYGDSGFNITLSDGGLADVHDYRLTLNGSHTTSLSLTEEPAALTGLWQPDGRAVDPFAVGSSSLRLAKLGSFVGLDPNGLWTLYVADVSGGGLAELREWGLTLTVIPEPGETVVISAVVLGLFGFWHRRRTRV
jgi:subtilisin-like proprotein convertase family protein